jgi:CheY-like chemotaxis protein
MLTKQGTERITVASWKLFTYHFKLPHDLASSLTMNKRTILIVDDEAHVVRVLRLMLERSGYAVQSAADGNEALAAMAQQRPDAMVTDIQMAGMGGRELCLTARARYPDEPFLILVMTSMTGADERDWVRQMEHVEFLEKPLSPRQLSARLAASFAPTTPEPTHVG